MRNSSLLIVGLALVVLGVLGLSLVAGGVFWTSTETGDVRLSGTDSSLGARIYLDGVGEDGSIPRTAIGPGMMGGGCVVCHGIDGRGGRFSMMMGTFTAPDVTYDALVGEHDDEGEHAAWDDDDIRRAIEDGVEPDGETLSGLMPRWRLSDEEFEALLEYLKELSGS